MDKPLEALGITVRQNLVMSYMKCDVLVSISIRAEFRREFHSRVTKEKGDHIFLSIQLHYQMLILNI